MRTHRHSTRAVAPQTQLSNFQGAAERSQTLEREVKEKNLLIGKLRHEGEPARDEMFAYDPVSDDVVQLCSQPSSSMSI